MTFRTALRILGHQDRPTLDTLDSLLGGLILAGGAVAIAGPVAAPLALVAALWGWAEQKNEAIGLLRKLLASVTRRRLGLGGYERAQLVAAAHTVLVVSSVMEAFQEDLGTDLSYALRAAGQDGYQMLRGDFGQAVLDGFYDSRVSFPSGGCGFLENHRDVHNELVVLTNRLVDFCYRTASLADRSIDIQGIDRRTRLLEKAEHRYETRYFELAAIVPEFAVWALLGQVSTGRHEAHELHRGVLSALSEQSSVLSRLEALLSMIAGDAQRVQRDLVATVRRSALAELDTSIVPRDAAAFARHRNIVFPTVRQIYVEPNYRWVRHDILSRISDEQWWQEQRVFADLDVRLAAYFASPEATRLPLLVLGHPGAGKSVLTKILAARLPEATFTTVRVPLRYVPAGAPIYQQVQESLNRTTHGRVAWHELTEQSAGTVRVILLDGLDELLQASEQSRSAFLDEVVEFQRTEAAQQRPVVVLVTSRTVVADRVSVPSGATVIKLDEFDDGQIEHWRQTWNRMNERAVAGGLIRPLGKEAVSRSGELSRQPLLLVMVALYSADHTLPPIDAGISSTTLYRRLMENYARRESAKPPGRDTEELPEFVRQQLHQLSVAAFAMFNRGRQDVTDAELGDDLVGLDIASVADRRIDAARRLTAQFFFIYTAQSEVENDQTRYSYEFLHPTLGEYLVAREVVEALRDTAESASTRRGNKRPDDDLLFALISHRCLAIRRSVLSFIKDSLAALDEIERGQIRVVLDTLIADCRDRLDSGRFNQYRPSPPDHVRELAAYSANLVLLKVLAEPDGMALYQTWSSNSDTMWSSTLSLWRAGLDENSWLSVLASLRRVDQTIYFREEPAVLTSWNSELLHVELRDDTQDILMWQMAAAIRTNPGYNPQDKVIPTVGGAKYLGESIRRREELMRWLFPALLLDIPPIDSDHLRHLLTQQQSEKASYPLIIAGRILSQRHHDLPPDIKEVLIAVLGASGHG